MNHKLFWLPFLYLLVLCTACEDPQPKDQPAASPTPPPPNVILLIGDGMGLSQLSAAYYYKENGTPSFSRFRHIGLMNTSSGSHKITDSAAGATAFSAGVKSYNGAIAVGMDSLPVPTILEQLSEEGYATGVIATSSITHATPASFYAHARSRQLAEDIALDLVDSEVDYFVGGGAKYFLRRSDGRNLYGDLEREGFTIDTNDVQPNIKADRYGALLAEDGMMQKNLGRDDILQRATQGALTFLSKRKSSFFLMVEGSQIDWGGHANDGEYLIAELLDFDAMVHDVLDFAEKDGNTLVIVTADHETGGFSLSSTMEADPHTGKSFSNYNKITPTFSTGGHSTSLIPVFAYGPGSEAFQGVYENTAIYDRMRELTER